MTASDFSKDERLVIFSIASQAAIAEMTFKKQWNTDNFTATFWEACENKLNSIEECFTSYKGYAKD